MDAVNPAPTPHTSHADHRDSRTAEARTPSSAPRRDHDLTEAELARHAEMREMMAASGGWRGE